MSYPVKCATHNVSAVTLRLGEPFAGRPPGLLVSETRSGSSIIRSNTADTQQSRAEQSMQFRTVMCHVSVFERSSHEIIV